MRIVANPEAFALLLVALAGLACRATSDREIPRHPDIVLLTLDTTRSDHLGLYGYFRNTSPVLDELAAESLVFERHIVPIATTLPSHTSLLTGTDPGEHAVLANLGPDGARPRLSPSLRTFAEFLQQDGYRTGAFIGATPLKRGSGLERGFETFDQPENATRRAAETNDHALAWVRSLAPGEPMFLWVHYFDPHGPYDPPAPYDTLFGADTRIDRWLATARASRVTHRPGRGRAVQTRQAIDAYDGEIRYVDHEIGRLLKALRGRRDWDSTVVVVFGDHGESLGQHGMAGHGQVWAEQLHAPLLMRIPGQSPARLSAVISTAAVVTTLLGHLDLPGSDGWRRQSSGIDVMAEDAEPRPALSRTSARRVELGERSAMALTGRRWKLVRDDGGDERLYDLDSDPYELHPLRPGPTAVHRKLRAALESRLSELDVSSDSLRPGAPRPVSDELRHQLDQLGYLVEDPAP